MHEPATRSPIDELAWEPQQWTLSSKCCCPCALLALEFLEGLQRCALPRTSAPCRLLGPVAEDMHCEPAVFIWMCYETWDCAEYTCTPL